MSGKSDGERWTGLRRVFRLPSSARRIKDEAGEELRFHIAERVDELVAAGRSRDEAEYEVRQRFGDIEAYQRVLGNIDSETMRSRDRTELLDRLRRDVVYGARSLARTPGFALIAAITLALGIGATTALFAVLEAVVLRPLPYPEPDRLVSVRHPVSGSAVEATKWGLSSAGYFYFRRENRTLADLGVYETGRVNVTGDGEAERVRAGIVSTNLLGILGARAAVGRLLNEADDKPRGAAVVMLGYDFWARRYGADPTIVGRMIDIEEVPHQVVGVAARGFNLPLPSGFDPQTDLAGFGVDIWVPRKLDPGAPSINQHSYPAIGRLKPGVTAAEAERDLQALTARFTELFPNVYSPGFMREYRFGTAVEPLHAAVLGPTVARSLWILFAAVAVVLLIACANVANLFLVRFEARRREAAIRTALGASRAHLATHYLAESFLLTTLAGLLGLALAYGAVSALPLIAPTTIPRLAGLRFGMGAAGFAALISLAAGVVFGMFPLARPDVDVATLRDGSRGLTVSPRQRNLRGALVVAQIALALVLLSCAGLLVRSFDHLRSVRAGFDSRGVLVFDLAVAYARYRTSDQFASLHRELHTKLTALPGVQSVGATTDLPLRGVMACSLVFAAGRWPLRPGEVPPCVGVPRVTPGFFRALGIQVRGRAPDWADVDANTGAVVVTRALAKRLWPGEDAIGKGINSNGGPTRPYYRVVGVVDELRASGLDRPLTEAVFYPVRNLPGTGLMESRRATVVVRAIGERPTALLDPIRRAIADIDPRIALGNAQTMDDVVERSTARTSFTMMLLAAAAAMALLLSVVGIYGVISYIVGQRRSEIGIRMALGARVWEVSRLVVLQSVRLAVAGVAVGLVCALAATRALRALLFEVSPTDPLVLASVSALLVVLAVLASFAPARRAARVDPVEALRAQ
jgi:putative ABC transport system permease protein